MEVLEAIRKRRSVRRYLPNPIPDDVMGRVLEAVRLAPCSPGGSSSSATRR
jgi:nitroreductase